MVKDGAIPQNCLDEVGDFNEAIDIEEIKLSSTGRQFVLSGGECAWGASMAMYWIYEIKQNKIRMLADLGPVYGVEVSSTTTNGYFDISTTTKANYETYAVYRMKFDGEKYVVTDTQYSKY